MRWLEKMRMRIKMFLCRGREVQRLDAELNFHVERQTAENIAAGMSPEEARQAALRVFGNPTLLREQVGETWSWNWLELFVHDLRIGIRALARTPGFALLTILVIAIGIGANVALFTVVRSVLLKPLPFREPARLLRLYEHSTDDKFPYNGSAGGIFAEWKKQNHGFSDLAILGGNGYNLSGTSGQLPEMVNSAVCSWNLFPMLGVKPALGRSFTADDDQPSANATVVLSWGLWERRFGGDASILNQTILLDAKPYTVIGIMPSWFAYPDQSVQLWTPIYHEMNAAEMQSPDSHDFTAVGRLKPGVTAAQATAELALIVRRVHDQHLDNPFVSKAAESRPLLDDVVGEIKSPLYVLFAATSCLLLIACLNVAGLLVARGATRRKELALRAALGSGRWRLLGQHLTESFLLSAAGGALGLLMAYAVIQWLVSTRQDMSRVEVIHMDGVAVIFALALVFLCAFFAGAVSSLSIKSDQIVPSLQDSSRAHSVGQRQVGLRKWLLSLEVGLTVILLIAAGLLLKSYARLRSADLGCITNNVLTMGFSLPGATYREPIQRLNFYEALIERVRTLPGVQAAGLVRVVPGQGYGGDTGFAIAEHPPLPPGQSQYAIVRWADSGYFATLGIPVLRGHTFDGNRRLDKANQVIISKSFAQQYFGDEDPIGKHVLGMSHDSYEIVGIVGDTRFLAAKPSQPILYFSLYMGIFDNATLAVRSTGDVASLALPIQQIVQQLNPQLAVLDVLTMNQLIGKSTLDASFDATLLLAFAVLSLVLAAAGLFADLLHRRPAYTGHRHPHRAGSTTERGAQARIARRTSARSIHRTCAGPGWELRRRAADTLHAVRDKSD